jgi:hypothetical protein
MVPDKPPPDGWVFGHRVALPDGNERVLWMSPDKSQHIWIRSQAVPQHRTVTEWINDMP